MPKYKSDEGINYFLNRIYIGLESGCMIWTGCRDKNGYGNIKYNGKHTRSHRVFYEIFNNIKIPDDKCVCHKCDNPSCVNPNHMFIGTRSENNTDRHIKGRSGDHRGENGSRAKLSESKVIEIIRRARAGESHLELGKMFGVSKHAIGAITCGRNWSHLERSLI